LLCLGQGRIALVKGWLKYTLGKLAFGVLRLLSGEKIISSHIRLGRGPVVQSSCEVRV
jgi:hypothetical protein